MTRRLRRGFERLFSWVARLYPEDFRDLLGGDMEEAFERRSREAFARGLLVGLVFATRSIAGAALGAILERLESAQRARRSRFVGPRRDSAMSTFVHDLVFGARALRKASGFAALAVLSLALGIAVNATVFSLVNTIMFSELPARDPDRLAWIFGVNEEESIDGSRMPLREFAMLQSESRTLSDVAAVMGDSFMMEAPGGGRRVKAARVSSNYHAAWGVDAVLGRTFAPGEDLPGTPPVAILSHGFWERLYGSGPVLGEVIRLDETAFTIVGVLSEKMEFGELSTIDVWVPLRVDPLAASMDERPVYVQGRLADGVTLSAAREEIAVFAERTALEHPATHDGWSLRLTPLTEDLINEEDAVLLLVAGLSVGFVLLIACANVANMLMARGSARERELAVRVALGASRLRLLRQLLTEGFLLAGLGAIAGLALTRMLLDALVHVTGADSWLYRSAEIDGNVLLFTLIISGSTPLLFSLVPSLRATRARHAEALSDGGRSETARSGFRLRQTLAAGQVAMALVLMIVTGLLVRTVIELRTMDLGFAVDDVVTVTLELPESRYDETAQLAFYQALVERVRAHPDVGSASYVDLHPLEPNRPVRSFAVVGAHEEMDRRLPSVQVFRAAAGYFRTARIPVLKGRAFTDRDVSGAQSVALVSETAATRYWPQSDPIGRSLRFDGDADGELIRVVGVVGDVLDLDGAAGTHQPQIYLPFEQSPVRSMVLVVRAAGEPVHLAGMLRGQVSDLDSDLLVDIRALSEIEGDLFARSNAILTLFVVFAGFALAMAAIGIYGVMAFGVSLRRREICIRRVLGANDGDVLRMVTVQGLRLIATGVVLGVVAALVVGRLLESVVVGITTTDPITFAAVLLVLVGVAFASNYLPARRAIGIDPTATLRGD